VEDVKNPDSTLHALSMTGHKCQQMVWSFDPMGLVSSSAFKAKGVYRFGNRGNDPAGSDFA
jgi:hypothetical protein